VIKVVKNVDEEEEVGEKKRKKEGKDVYAFVYMNYSV